jgi:D-threo-aldose 1-dehydrogenase
MADDGAVQALADLKEQGIVARIGVAGGPVDLLARYLDSGVFDVVLSHNRHTLLDRSADPLFELARERGIGVLNAAPFGGGMLAKGPNVQRAYAYGRRDERIAAAASAMQDACTRHHVPLAAAALQFSLRSELVDSTVVGISAPERVAQTLDHAALDIPAELWDELESLVPAPELWLS